MTMGLDLVLALVVLISAVRGWLQGFVNQTLRIASLIACVYLADPVRDRAKPYVVPYLASIEPDLVDRLLWWVAAVLTYVALVGIASLVIKMTRRPEIPGISQSGRNDQFAGFFLGAVKGLLVAAFMVAGFQKYALEQVKTVTWAEEQAKASWALQWSSTYQPVPKIWASRPVRHFVDHINRMGLQKPGESSQSAREGEGLDPSSLFGTGIRRSDLKNAGQDRSALESRPSAPAPGSSLPAESTVVDPEAEKSGTGGKPVSKAPAGDSN
jgi:uncharacterized membrane protein required for colicin V production